MATCWSCRYWFPTVSYKPASSRGVVAENVNGLTYLIADEGLVADPLITQWVEEELQRLISEDSEDSNVKR